MIGETFPQPNVPKNTEPEYDDAWYESQTEQILKSLPTELSQNLRKKIDDLDDSKQAYEHVQEFVRRRNNAIQGMSVQINEVAHVELESDDQKILNCVEREIVAIQRSLEDPDKYIGEGMVAKVFESDTWPKLCYKVVHDLEKYRKGNSVERESSFLGRLNDLSVDGVRTPHAYFIVQELGMTAIGMERLKALSLDDVRLRQPDALQELKRRGFDVDDFFRRIEAYVVEMHKRGIYHCDLYGRNIMIDWETLLPRIIDFGRSEHFDFESDVPELVASDDFEKIKIAKKELKSALLTC